MGEEDEDDSEDNEHWLWVHCEGSSAAYRDMEMFAGTITDSRRAERLLEALEVRGPFRRFRDVLARWPDDFTRWHQFSDERRRGRSREWLAGAGYQAMPPTKPEAQATEPA